MSDGLVEVDRSLPGDDAFDRLASDYDSTFTDTVIGSVMRRAVHRRLATMFGAGARVLELNCGTGVDAAWMQVRGVEVLATDASAEMVAVTAGRIGADRTRQVAIEDIGNALGEDGFDGVLSNFGGLNCVGDVDAALAGVAAVVRPGGRVLLCVMGPFVPWEIAWFAVRGQGRSAVRRMRRGGANWRGMTIRYPSARRVRRAAQPWFTCDRTWAIGAVVPPPYTEAVLAGGRRRQRLIEWADRLERRIERNAAVIACADHYVVELTRR